ncbi:MAG TPA: phospho-N-acetylmuramoyl-pentapeptide-transferase [Candidatus Omnitrophota bacterium]|mgnify:CR=1 FL=1|nr:phospho-N-acetylmuramoyl-pentapeptide-transferase [Candidatus Omnitrophota bacterium]
MLYYFLYPLRDHSIFFNVFRYITFRSVGASITAFLVCLIFGPAFIRWLSGLCMIQTTKRDYAPQLDNLRKGKGTVPTMGGLIIITGILVASLMWGNLENRLFLLSMATLVWFGTIGFIDDFLKVRNKDSRGMRSRMKFFGQVAWGLALGWYLYRDVEFGGTLYVPFLKHTVFYLGLFYIPFVVLVITGSSNALNLTDGLDGLAIGCMIFAAGAFGVISYVSGHVYIAQYLQIPFFFEAGELAVFCSALVGAGVGFLWYNSYPATVFMGDTGSLSLGGALGAIAIFIKKELVLLIVGGIFAWEALSVILQVISFKTTGKRIFLMSPFHHHLQLKGWPESKVTIRLWIIAFILALIGLGTLKLR